MAPQLAAQVELLFCAMSYILLIMQRQFYTFFLVQNCLSCLVF